MIETIGAWMQTIPSDAAAWAAIAVFIALDVILGTVKAAIRKELSSTKARLGLMHKAGFVGAMLLCNLIDIVQRSFDLGYSVPLTAGCAVMICVCEIMSICEHIQELNPEINLSFLKGKDSEEDEGK